MQTYKLENSLLHVYTTPKNLNLALVQRFIFLARQEVQVKGLFTVALSGGSTPKSFYKLLAEKEFSRRVPWDKVHIFLGDERCVAQDNPESNYKMIQDTLLTKIDIPSKNIHAYSKQDKDPQASAAEYEKTICQIVSISSNSYPEFDLILLGLGPDGHTASLFPDTEALAIQDKLVVANYVNKLQTNRLTFTFPLLNAAKHIVFMVEGEGKKEILKEVLEKTSSFKQTVYPACLVHPQHGTLEWFVDSIAVEDLDLQKSKSIV